MHDDVMISVDPHKASNTGAVTDSATKVVIASRRFANTTEGYLELRRFSERWQRRRWAVEGCHGAGRSLAQRLVTTASWSLTCRPSWRPGCGSTRKGTAARPTPRTQSLSGWPR